MRIEQSTLQSVVFICEEPADDGVVNRSAHATGFLISVHSRNGIGTYLVTAKHVVEKLGEQAPYIGLNDRDGNARTIHLDGARWIRHPELFCDVALCEFAIPAWAAATPFSARSFISDFKFESKEIGEGDPVFVVGLFNRFYGRTRHLPLVHNGGIALIPGSDRIPARILDRNGARQIVEQQGYLIEAQTLGGCSGSPVFVRRSLRATIVPQGSDTRVNAVIDGALFLLGVWSASWDGPPMPTVAEDRQLANQRVPVGFGIATPASQIIQTLQSAGIWPMLPESQGPEPVTIVTSGDVSHGPMTASHT